MRAIPEKVSSADLIEAMADNNIDQFKQWHSEGLLDLRRPLYFEGDFDLDSATFSGPMLFCALWQKRFEIAQWLLQLGSSKDAKVVDMGLASYNRMVITLINYQQFDAVVWLIGRGASFGADDLMRALDAVVNDQDAITPTNLEAFLHAVHYRDIVTGLKGKVNFCSKLFDPYVYAQLSNQKKAGAAIKPFAYEVLVDCLKGLLALPQSDKERRKQLLSRLLAVRIKGIKGVRLPLWSDNTLMQLLTCNSTLLSAVLHDNDAVMRLLEIRNEEGNTVLHLAVHYGDVEAVRELLSHCSKVDECIKNKNNNGETVLHVAVKNLGAEMLNVMWPFIQDIKPLLAMKDSYGLTPKTACISNSSRKLLAAVVDKPVGSFAGSPSHLRLKRSVQPRSNAVVSSVMRDLHWGSARVDRFVAAIVQAGQYSLSDIDLAFHNSEFIEAVKCAYNNNDKAEAVAVFTEAYRAHVGMVGAAATAAMP